MRGVLGGVDLPAWGWRRKERPESRASGVTGRVSDSDPEGSCIPKSHCCFRGPTNDVALELEKERLSEEVELPASRWGSEGSRGLTLTGDGESCLFDSLIGPRCGHPYGVAVSAEGGGEVGDMQYREV